MILLKELPGVRFRDDILRGVRLFAIAFAAVLIGVAGYRMFKAPADVQGAAQSAPAAPEAVQPPQESGPSPVVETAVDSRPMVVPPPPPAGRSSTARSSASAVPVKQAPRGRMIVVQDAPVRANRAPAPSGREFESSEPVALSSAPAEESPEANTAAPKKGVGYKSLIEANTNRPVESAPQTPTEESKDTPAKGNRFFKAVGKIFRNGKKDPPPSSLQPNQPEN